LSSNEVTALHAEGNAFFAAVARLEALLPAVGEARNAVVIFGLRGRESITTSGIVMLERYARKLQAGGNKLMLIGVEPRVRREFDRTGVTSLLGEENIFASSSSLGGPLQEALRVANEWVTRKTENVQND
jgi:SulP family sulfate permease